MCYWMERILVIFMIGCSHSLAKIAINNNQLQINCDTGEHIQGQTIQNKPSNITSVRIENCAPPNGSYAEVFQSLNLAVQQINKVVLKKFQPPRVLEAAHFDGLLVSRLEVLAEYDSSRDNWVFPTKDFLKPITPTLRTLSISGALLQELPENSIRKIVLEFGASETKIGGCAELQDIEIWEWNFPALPTGIFPDCKKLEKISLNWMNAKNALVGAKSIKHLFINRNNDLNTIDNKIFQDLTELRLLHLPQNSINQIDRNAFTNLKKLEEVDFKDNNLVDWSKTVDAISDLPALHAVILDSNRGLDGCASMNATESSSVQRLSFQHTNLKTMCFGAWPGLKHLDLRENKIDMIQLSGIPIPKGGDVEIDLRKNPVTKFHNTEENYNEFSKRFTLRKPKLVKLLIDGAHEDCDCNFNWIKKATEYFPFEIEGTICSNKTIAQVPGHLVYCEVYQCDSCTCTNFWNDNTVVADCVRADLREIPKIPRLRKLIAPDNRIGILEAEDFSHIFQFADLSNNRISHIPATVAEVMFSLPERRLMLADNPLVRVCDILPFLRAIRQHKNQVLDYENVTCSNTGENIDYVALDSLCKNIINEVLIGSISALVIFLIILYILYKRYKYRIQLFLFTRGLFLNWITEEDIECEREYDVFISFCHDDDEFVKNYILPELKDYKLCIHYRDWIAGEWIPRQIASSIENSRRTLLIISKNFVDSLWGMQEFRMAHVASLQEGHRRLIAVLIHDINQRKLDADLKNYLSMNTYIKWGDPWFSQKLKYGLPRYDRKLQRKDNLGVDLDEFQIAAVRYLPVENHL